MAGDTTTGPSSWRDVYDLVQGVRDDLSGQIGDMRTTITDLVQNQEHRLTVLETTQASHSVQLAVNSTNIDLMKEQQTKDEARTNALEGAKRAGTDHRRWLIDAALSLGIVVTGVLAVVH